MPPFGEIKPEHFVPAIKEGIAQQRKEIEAIAANPAPPTFANTIEAMENAGELLAKVNPVFSNLQSSNTNEQLQAINREVAPLLAALRDDIRLNPALFAPREDAVGRARHAEAAAGPGAAARRDLQELRARRREPDARAEGALPRDQRRDLRRSGSSSATTCCATRTATAS